MTRPTAPPIAATAALKGTTMNLTLPNNHPVALLCIAERTAVRLLDLLSDDIRWLFEALIHRGREVAKNPTAEHRLLLTAARRTAATFLGMVEELDASSFEATIGIRHFVECVDAFIIDDTAGVASRCRCVCDAAEMAAAAYDDEYGTTGSRDAVVGQIRADLAETNYMPSPA